MTLSGITVSTADQEVGLNVSPAFALRDDVVDRGSVREGLG